MGESSEIGLRSLEFPRSTSRMRASTLVETRGEVASDHIEVVFRLKAWDSLAQGNALGEA